MPDTLIINGVTYNVTVIAENAFSKNKNVKKVVIGENVKKNVGNKSFKGISSKAVIKVPSGKLTSYKKI